MAAKKKPQSTPLPQAGRTATPFVSKYGFKINPVSAASALDLLRRYVEERANLLRPDSPVKITEAADAIRLMDVFYKFNDQVADLVKSPGEKAYDTLRFSVIPNLMDDEGITSVGVEGIGRTNLQDDVQCKVLDPDGLKEWLVSKDKEDMIKETVNAQTLAAFVRARMKQAGGMKDATPEEIAALLPGTEVMTVKPIVRAVITRG